MLANSSLRIYAAPGVLQALDATHGLGMRFVEILPGALVLTDELAGPENVESSQDAGELLYRLLKTGNLVALEAVYMEELNPEGLPLGRLTGYIPQFIPEGDGAVFDFIPRERHRQGGSRWSLSFGGRAAQVHNGCHYPLHAIKSGLDR